MSKTVKDHFEECRSISEIVKNANALAVKLQEELKVCRATLDALEEYQFPKVHMTVPYALRGKSDDKTQPASVIRMQIRRINEILGDRA